jgi:hypothetical protein
LGRYRRDLSSIEASVQLQFRTSAPARSYRTKASDSIQTPSFEANATPISKSGLHLRAWCERKGPSGL